MPINHSYFKDTSPIQWLWYYYQDLEDQRDHFEEARDMMEYHASFVEPELVNKIIEKRKSKEQEGIIGTGNDNIFNESLKSMFGRGTSIGDGNQSQEELDRVRSMSGIIKAHQDYQTIMKSTQTPFNYKYWADLPLE